MKIFCKHEYEKIRIEQCIKDKDGFTMGLYVYKCKKCDKVKIKDSGARGKLEIYR